MARRNPWSPGGYPAGDTPASELPPPPPKMMAPNPTPSQIPEDVLERALTAMRAKRRDVRRNHRLATSHSRREGREDG